MNTPPPWTPAHDAQLRRLRVEGAEWPDIARILGRSRWAVMVRAAEIGARRASTRRTPAELDIDREPLPAGHPKSWGALVAGTVLDGTDYPLPFFFR